MQKILVIATVVISLATAALGFLNKTKLDEARQHDAKTSSELTATNKNLKTTSEKLKASEEKNAVLASDAEKTAAELAEARTKAEKATSALTDLQKEISDKDSTISQQKTDLAAKDTRITELESKTSSSSKPGKSESDELKKQLEEKDILTASLQGKLKEQESQLAALKERESLRKANMMKKGLEGRILAVNPSWNFVVLSLGDRNGVVSNAEMLIKRGSQLIGKIRITSVEPSTSIADIVANSVRAGLSVQPGDTVIYTGAGDEIEKKIP